MFWIPPMWTFVCIVYCTSLVQQGCDCTKSWVLGGCTETNWSTFSASAWPALQTAEKGHAVVKTASQAPAQYIVQHSTHLGIYVMAKRRLVWWGFGVDTGWTGRWKTEVNISSYPRMRIPGYLDTRIPGYLDREVEEGEEQAAPRSERPSRMPA